MKKTIVAAVSTAFLIGATSAASAQLCMVGIFAAAIYASAAQKRELTVKEAWSCGLLLGQDQEAEAKAGKKKTAGKSRPKTN